MTLSAKVQARLDQLIDEGEKIKATKHMDQSVRDVFAILHTWVDEERARQWAMSVLVILKSAFGEDNDNYQQVKKYLDKCALYREFCIMQASVKAALDDLKGDYFFESKVLLEAEVFGDLLEQAEELQKAGYKDAAAVLAGGVLEKQMRSMCARRSITLLKSNGKHKMINDMNDDLAKAGAYNVMKKKLVTAWADLRNNAAHGNTTVYNCSEVDAFLRDVTDFCANMT